MDGSQLPNLACACRTALDNFQERRNYRVRKPDTWEGREVIGGWRIWERYYHGHLLVIECAREANMMMESVDRKFRGLVYTADIAKVEAELEAFVDSYMTRHCVPTLSQQEQGIKSSYTGPERRNVPR